MNATPRLEIPAGNPTLIVDAATSRVAIEVRRSSPIRASRVLEAVNAYDRLQREHEATTELVKALDSDVTTFVCETQEEKDHLFLALVNLKEARGE